MRLPDDDEIYQVDETYLGPPGRYIAPMRQKAIFAWIIIGPFLAVVLMKLGMPWTLLTVGLFVIGVTWLAMWIADHTTPERSFGSLLATFKNEVSAKRETRKQYRAAGPANLEPQTRALRRWKERAHTGATPVSIEKD